MDKMQFYQSLVDFILHKKRSGYALIVGINGADGSGKTMLAGNLSRLLKEAGYPVCRVSVDGFHHPRKHRYRRGEESPEAYYHDSINYKAFADKALKPVFKAQTYPVQCQIKLLDLAQDKEDMRFQDVDENTVVLAEGVFLFRPEIYPFLHTTIFVRADFGAILERVKVRDLDTLGSAAKIQERYERKYIPGQKLYFEEIKPEKLADIVIDNTNFESPRIILP